MCRRHPLEAVQHLFGVKLRGHDVHGGFIVQNGDDACEYRDNPAMTTAQRVGVIGNVPAEG